ncbi:hypothetical protein PTKU46_84470 [Paraburkholderia terrae]
MDALANTVHSDLPKYDGHSELRTLTSEKSGSGVQLRDVARHFASGLPSPSVAIIAWPMTEPASR